MKKSKKKVASTMDERAQLISGESSARGYWVAMLGIFVTIMVASKTHSVELVQSLLIITFFGSMCLGILEALSDGEIEETRHRSYVQMYNEVKDIKSWQIKE